MTLAGIPGRTFTGELDYIYPYAESRTRSIKVRLTFDNSELLLKPEMFAEVVIKSDKQLDTVVIPSEAVIRSGRSDRVFVVRAPGKFEPITVKLGFQSAGQVAVLEGIEDGDEVVVSAQFLVDSESSLREATMKMMEVKDSQAANSPKMDGMDMDTDAEPDSHTETDRMDMDTDAEPDSRMEMDRMNMDDMDGEHTDD
jgi:Cu(I)/Ag(I) efflux system membrane fusion protein